jgi:hypothetical protein
MKLRRMYQIDAGQAVKPAPLCISCGQVAVSQLNLSAHAYQLSFLFDSLVCRIEETRTANEPDQYNANRK